MSTASQLLTSAQRPIPLRIRPDLVCRPATEGGWIIKDPVALRYYRLHEPQFRVLELLDGSRNLEEIRQAYHREFPTPRFSNAELQRLITDFHRKGIALSDRDGQGPKLLKTQRDENRRRWLQSLKNPLYIKLPGWDPEPTLRFLAPWCNWMGSRGARIVGVVLVLAAWSLLLIHFREFQSRLPNFSEFFDWKNLLLIWIVLGASKVIHEFAHGLACKRYGGECHEMGVLFLVFSPCLYCDVSDAWLLPSKSQRLMIGAAGMLIETVLSALAVFGWWFSYPGLFHLFCLNLFVVSTITTVIFNANPLLRYDGYYMLSDWLEIPNLRARSERHFRESFARFMLGVRLPSQGNPLQRGQIWLLLFAIAATTYRWVVLGGVLFFLYTFLKPYHLQSVGILLAILAMMSALNSVLMGIARIYLEPRSEPVRWMRTVIGVGILGGVACLVLLQPIPWYLEAPLEVQPSERMPVYTPVAGRLSRAWVHAGERVEQGDLLVELEDPRLQQEYRDLQIQVRVQQEEVAMLASIPDPAQEQLAKVKLVGLEAELQEHRRRGRQLRVRAPCAGTVIAAPESTESPLDVTDPQLPRWDGSPLDSRNRGCWLPPRTHLLSIASSDQFDAVLLIDQADRNEIGENQEVHVKLDYLPEKVITAQITELAFRPVTPRNEPNKPDAQAAPNHGPPAVMYQAIVKLPEDGPTLQPGLRGRARITVATRTIGQWIWRGICQTFRFRM